MERIQEISFLVLGQLAAGGTLLLALPSLTAAGLSFYRTNGIVFGITFLLGLMIGGPSWAAFPNPVELIFYTLFGLTLLIYNLRLWFRHPCSTPALLYGALFGHVGFILTLMQSLSPEERGLGLASLMLPLFSLASSLLLGAGVLAMLLGHRYLTDPALSIVPLQQMAQIFMGLVFLQGGFAVLQMGLFMPHAQMIYGLQLATLEGVFLWIRLAIGLIGPMILAPMILKTVSERATMSATGLLYIAMLMVIIGSLFSHFFLFIHGYLI